MSLCWVLLPSKMNFLTLVILLQGLGLVSSTSPSPPLGMTVHVVPLDSTEGKTVRAHFTAIVSGACSDVTGLCADGDDCVVERNTVPFTGTKPGGDWCSHQWQKTLPADFADTIALGSSAQMFVALKTNPVVRANSGKLNHPVFVALPPPLRANEKCPHHFPVSVRDLDGDRVHCRFASEAQGECSDCEPHSFIELDEESCALSFTGNASIGVYHIYLMAEDVVPAPNVALSTQRKPMSSVPFILSLSVESAEYSCSAEPVFTVDNPAPNSVLHILPFDEKSFTVNFDSNQESVVEVAVIGPPELYRTGFLSLGPLASLSMAWVRTQNDLTRLLPICFVANSQNLQSEPRCVWLHQREMTSLPAGTELTCSNTEMKLVLPIGSFQNLNLDELQLNSPDCPITFNDTHLTATILLEGCGTKAVHSGDELIYTNTLKTVHAPTQVIRRKPALVLPLACRIPRIQAKGPQYEISIPVEKEVFGEVEFKLEFYFPGEGPLARFTKNAEFRTDNRRFRRETQEDDDAEFSQSPSDSAFPHVARFARSATEAPSTTNSSISDDLFDIKSQGKPGDKIDKLDLHVTSNCSVDRAEIVVSSCIESATPDFANATLLLNQGCTSTAGTLEIVTDDKGTKIYRLDLITMNSEGSTMYVRCTVNLCITTLPSQVCPDLCTTKFTRATMVNSVFSKSYTITSGAVSRVVTTPPPTTTTTTARPKTTTTTTEPAAAPTTTTATTTVSTTAVQNTTAHAAEKAPAMVVAVMTTLVGLLLQLFL